MAYEPRHPLSKPLAEAAETGDIDQVRALLDRGAPIDPTDFATPLYWAIQSADRAVATLLLERGADLERRNSNGTTPLHEAVALAATKGGKGRLDMVRLLCDAGADVHYRGAGGNDAILVALSFLNVLEPKRAKLVARVLPLADELLARGADPNSRRQEVPRVPVPISLVVDRGYEPILERLLAAGADPNPMRAAPWAPYHPLHQAVERGNPRAVQMLMAAGARTDPEYLHEPIRAALEALVAT